MVIWDAGHREHGGAGRPPTDVGLRARARYMAAPATFPDAPRARISRCGCPSLPFRTVRDEEGESARDWAGYPPGLCRGGCLGRRKAQTARPGQHAARRAVPVCHPTHAIVLDRSPRPAHRRRPARDASVRAGALAPEVVPTTRQRLTAEAKPLRLSQT